MKKGFFILLTVSMLACLCACGSNVCEHDFSVADIEAATCTAEGVKTFSCTKCSDTMTESIAKTSHTYDKGKVTIAATCTATGTKTYTCTGCDDTKTEVIEKASHTYDNGKITTAATCTATGTKTYTCTGCDDTKTEVIEKTSHNYNSKVTTAATCTTTGTKAHTCSSCGDTRTESIAKTSHSYKENIDVQATCTSQGKKTKTCSTCGDTKTEAIDKLAHKYSSATCTDAAKCNTCGTTNGSALGHNWSAATCSSAKKCTRCQKTDGSPLKHSYNSSDKCKLCGATAEAYITLPNTPASIGYYLVHLRSSCKVTGITSSLYASYSSGLVYEITFTGECTYNEDGSGQSSSMRIGYKLYDQDGFVVASGIARSESVSVGEKFKEAVLLRDLNPGETYRLEILDAN